jgi:hypothetical protein
MRHTSSRAASDRTAAMGFCCRLEGPLCPDPQAGPATARRLSGAGTVQQPNLNWAGHATVPLLPQHTHEGRLG